MRERFLPLGGVLTTAALFTGIGGEACAFGEQPIQGTVLDIRREPWEERIETRAEMLSDCPEGTTHLSNACLPKPYEVTVKVWDAPDTVITLQKKNHETVDVYVYPRVARSAQSGQEITISRRYGSVNHDPNNTETVIGKTPLK